MLPFSYEDRFPTHNASPGYGATNEEPKIISEFLRGKIIHNGLGIASAGEVTFFSLLPRVQQQLVLVDHSYRSLQAFCTKAVMLATLGPTVTKKLLSSSDRKGVDEAVATARESLPATMANPPGVAFGYGEPIRVEHNNVRREWSYADVGVLRRSIANLHKIKLIHGDLSDAKDRAPYDLAYFSNALEHANRPGASDSGYPSPTVLSKMLTPHAHVLWLIAGGDTSGSNRQGVLEWPPLTSVKGYRTTWQYRLSKANAKPDPEVARFAANF